VLGKGERDGASFHDRRLQLLPRHAPKEAVVVRAPLAANPIDGLYVTEDVNQLLLVTACEMDRRSDLARIEFGGDVGLEVHEVYRGNPKFQGRLLRRSRRQFRRTAIPSQSKTMTHQSTGRSARPSHRFMSSCA